MFNQILINLKTLIIYIILKQSPLALTPELSFYKLNFLKLEGFVNDS